MVYMLGNKIKQLRLDKKLTQAELGKIIGTSTSTIGMYEQNRRDPDTTTLSKIADYFNVSIDYLLGRNHIESINSHLNPIANKNTLEDENKTSIYINGQKLKLLREEKKLSQKELGLKLNLSESIISLYESEKRTPDNKTLYNIAKFFNVSADYLLDISDNLKNETSNTKNNNSYDSTYLYKTDTQSNISDVENDFSGLDKVYLSYAKEAQENKIDPADIRLVLDTIKRLREQNK